MSGLVGYGSSDEEDVVQEIEEGHSKIRNGLQNVEDSTPISQPVPHIDDGKHSNMASVTSEPLKLSNPPLDAHAKDPTAVSLTGPVEGPTVGTAMDDDMLSGPSSPYTSNRISVRDLTLPTVPNLDIPPSPPSSPPPGLEAKLDKFLKLKKQGIHFNEKLARSSALKNPSLLNKLLQVAGLDIDQQYSTTLSNELWNPKEFPAWAYKDELSQAQQEAQKRQAEELAKGGRDHVDFVSASTSMPSYMPAQVSFRGSQGSAAERIMAGLNGENNSARRRSRSPRR